MQRLICLVLTCVLLSGPALGETESGWPDELRLGPFQYHADFSLAPHYRTLSEVAKLQTDIPKLLKIDDVHVPIDLYLFRQKSTFREYVSMHFPKVALRRALFIKQADARMVFAFESRDVATDLRHECTHAVLHAVLPMVPLWLDEGLAEYFESPPEERQFGSPHLTLAYRDITRKNVTLMRELEALEDFSKMNSKHYRDSWTWVHFLLHGPPEGKQILHRFLQDVQAHVPPASLRIELEKQFPDLHEALAKHFAENVVPYRVSRR